MPKFKFNLIKKLKLFIVSNGFYKKINPKGIIMTEDNKPEILEALEIGAEESKVVSITEAAKINNVTRQAIYVAIKLKKLRAEKKTSRWQIHLDDLANYRRQKYSRTKSIYNGELLFNNERGFYSVNQVAKMLNVPVQKIYYATRIGLLKAHRRGSAWVIHVDDVKEYRENYLNKKSKKRKVV